ncbi:hypothetical protein H634G_07086 [Metarhizium anisopliae BRIP 53293]|uniref:Myb-like domain-containing protein n=1 Tax=Metarhizium anisopliae BRIP 53293 TaxID=1291518 RepID=A0A0D9NTG1_METAN|nr:hypothetical protein H634G_07086 [Metarhizium anisopliae BRIP 53293]KJK94456.1 hypothetical protein H633G_01661 [Metarhizium anisopliae BRIP 53284]
MAFPEWGLNQSFNEEFFTLSQDKLHYESVNEESPLEETINAPSIPPPMMNYHHNGFPFTPPPEALPDLHDGISFSNEAYCWNPFPLYGFNLLGASTVVPAEQVYRMAPSIVPATHTTYNALPMPYFGMDLPGGSYLAARSFSPASSTKTTLAAGSISTATVSPPPANPDQGNHTPASAAYAYASRPQAASEAPAVPLPPVKSSATPRTEEDRILMECRRLGMTYSAIRKKLRTKVAESTLRGRVRQLTLPPRDRERKPAWSDKDIKLLREAVPLYRKPGSRPKVLWEQVGRYIPDHGGSRKFSGKTCHAKFREVTGRDY